MFIFVQDAHSVIVQARSWRAIARRFFDREEADAIAVIAAAGYADWRAVDWMEVQRLFGGTSPYDPKPRALHKAILLWQLEGVRRELRRSRQESVARLAVKTYLAGPKSGEYVAHEEYAGRLKEAQRRGAKIGRNARVTAAADLRRELQIEADRVWARQPGWSKLQVAKTITRHADRSAHTVRTFIVKPPPKTGHQK